MGGSRLAGALVALAALAMLAGCGNSLRNSSSLEVAAFEAAGPVLPEIDAEALMRCRGAPGPYRVGPGDILEVTMPAMMWAATADSALASATVASGVGDRVWRPADDITQRRRVNEKGVISLPIVGDIAVGDKTLIEIETLIVSAYHPKYAVHPPAVVLRVGEYNTETVYVVGGVDKPGAYELKRDEMSLVNLLMKAGGIVKEGAEVVRIRRTRNEPRTDPVIVPIKGLNIPFADVRLNAGETVEVARLNPQFFTVIGLVKKPGVFPYPPDVRYNLMQALSSAGGVNDLADPRHVTVYRKDARSQIVSAVFPIKATQANEASRIEIHPGDVVAVEQTNRTSTRLLMAEIFQINLGVQGIGWFGNKAIIGS